MHHCIPPEVFPSESSHSLPPETGTQTVKTHQVNNKTKQKRMVTDVTDNNDLF